VTLGLTNLKLIPSLLKCPVTARYPLHARLYDAQLSADFTAAIQYLSNEVLAKYRVVNTNATRNISSTSRRDQSRNRNKNAANTNNTNASSTDRFSKEGDIILNDGTYSNHIWRNVLNEDERKYCESLRQRRRNRRRNSQARNENVHHSLSHLFRDVGFRTALIPDSAASLTKGKFKKVASRAQVPN